MTRDDIIRMAKESGWNRVGHNPETGPAFPVLVERLQRFAALVAEAEREACAKLAGPHLDGAIAAAIRARGEA
jgi:hypothetical protein